MDKYLDFLLAIKVMVNFERKHEFDIAKGNFQNNLDYKEEKFTFLPF